MVGTTLNLKHLTLNIVSEDPFARGIEDEYEYDDEYDPVKRHGLGCIPGTKRPA